MGILNFSTWPASWSPLLAQPQLCQGSPVLLILGQNSSWWLCLLVVDLPGTTRQGLFSLSIPWEISTCHISDIFCPYPLVLSKLQLRSLSILPTWYPVKLIWGAKCPNQCTLLCVPRISIAWMENLGTHFSQCSQVQRRHTFAFLVLGAFAALS